MARWTLFLLLTLGLTSCSAPQPAGANDRSDPADCRRLLVAPSGEILSERKGADVCVATPSPSFVAEEGGPCTSMCSYACCDRARMALESAVVVGPDCECTCGESCVILSSAASTCRKGPMQQLPAASATGS